MKWMQDQDGQNINIGSIAWQKNIMDIILMYGTKNPGSKLKYCMGLLFLFKLWKEVIN